MVFLYKVYLFVLSQKVHRTVNCKTNWEVIKDIYVKKYISHIFKSDTSPK